MSKNFGLDFSLRKAFFDRPAVMSAVHNLLRLQFSVRRCGDWAGETEFVQNSCEPNSAGAVEECRLGHGRALTVRDSPGRSWLVTDHAGTQQVQCRTSCVF